MKKLSVLILSVAIFICTTFYVCAEDVVINFNNNSVTFSACNIDDNNYLRLCDLAVWLSTTEAEFDVDWSEDNASVKITTNTPYSGLTTSDEPPAITENSEITHASPSIYLNGKRVSAKAYDIDGHTYFKLRDVAKLIDFGLYWSSDTGIKIDTSRGYTLTIDEEKAVLVDYAQRRHPEFTKQNEGWHEDKKYYNFADVDHDGKYELAVKKSAGITLYKVIDGEVQRMYCDPLPESNGETQYHYVTYNGEDCVAYITQERILLNILSGNSLSPLVELKPGEIDKITFPQRYTLEELGKK